MQPFGRITSHEDRVRGRDGDVALPAGTMSAAGSPPRDRRCSPRSGWRFSFFFHGHHHAAELWGADAQRFNPDRRFAEAELRRVLGTMQIDLTDPNL